MISANYPASGTKIRRILFPTRFSPRDEVAYRIARALAREADAELLIVHAANARLLYESAEYRERIERRMELLQSYDPEIHATTVLVGGSPASEIAALGRDLDCDLVVMRRSRPRWTVGRFVESVSQRVERLATCPVVVVTAAAVASPHRHAVWPTEADVEVGSESSIAAPVRLDGNEEPAEEEWIVAARETASRGRNEDESVVGGSTRDL